MHHITKENAAEMAHRGKGVPKNAKRYKKSMLSLCQHLGSKEIVLKNGTKRTLDEYAILELIKQKPDKWVELMLQYTEKKPTQEVSATINNRLEILHQLQRLEVLTPVEEMCLPNSTQ